jgi:hypothetical protein
MVTGPAARGQRWFRPSAAVSYDPGQDLDKLLTSPDKCRPVRAGFRSCMPVQIDAFTSLRTVEAIASSVENASSSSPPPPSPTRY